MKTHITISPGGDCRTFGDAPEWIDGERTVKRVSHIWPVNPVKRVTFRLLRLAFGDRGKVAEWSRQMYGPWCCIIIGSNATFTHQSRKVVLKWERELLEGAP